MSFLKPSHTIPSDLPFWQIRQEFTTAVKSTDVDIVVVGAETGSGKTVCSSIILAQEGMASMTTIPLIIATEAIYNYIATNARNPKHVGYATHGETHYTDESLIKFVTTKHGFNCLKRVISNHKKFLAGKPFKGIRKFDDKFVFVLDEAHHTTQENMGTFKLARKALKLGLLKKLVVMSATLGNMNFSGFNVCNLRAEGRSFPIEINYNDRNIDFSDPKIFAQEIMRKFDQIYRRQNILIFVPGTSDVDTIVQELEKKCDPSMIVFGIHSQADKSESDEAVMIRTDGLSKIVVSTNSTESGITIPDIDEIIDSCVQKTPHSSSNGCGTTLVTEFAPQDKLTQRSGRCGRTKPGKCNRLITRDTWNKLKQNDLSDMERIFPFEMVIDLLAEDLDAQDMLDICEEKYETIISKLIRLELITESREVTTMGRSISRFPYSIENAVVAYKLQQLATNPENNLVVLLASICMSASEGSGGNSFFFIPKEHRKSKQGYMEMQFGGLKGKTDFETYINIFREMFEYIEENTAPNKHTDKICADYARTHHMNNKILKKTRKCFVKLVNLLYNSSYNDRSFVKCVKDFGAIDYDMHTMEKVYEIFASAHSDKIFGDKTITRKETVYFKNGDTSPYVVDNIRSFSDFECYYDCQFIALQVVEIRGAVNRNCISGIFPLPKRTCRLEEYNENAENVEDVKDDNTDDDTDDESDDMLLRMIAFSRRK